MTSLELRQCSFGLRLHTLFSTLRSPTLQLFASDTQPTSTMVFIDYHLSTSSKKSVVIPFRFRSNDEPIYILTSTNGWNAVQMTKVDTIDSDKHVHLYKHTVILPSDVSNIQYKFRIGENLYLHDDTEDTSKFNEVDEKRTPYSILIAPDGFGGFNNTFEVLWDPICSTSTHEPSTVIETPSDAGSLQVSEEESDPVGNSQMPSNGLPAANDQKLHAFTGSALHTSQTLFPELVSTTPGAVNGAEPKESGHTPLEKVRTVAATWSVKGSLEEFRAKLPISRLTSFRMPFAVERSLSISMGPVSPQEPI